MNPQIIVLITFLIFGVAAFSGKVKIHVAAMIIPVVLEITGVLTFEETWAGLVNSSVVMMAAMFVVAAGLNKTDVVVRMSRLVLKSNSSDLSILLSLLVPTILLGSVVNGTATMAIMLPIVTQICSEYKRPLSKFMMPLYVMVGLWVGFIPTGGNAASYLAQNSIIEKLGGVGQFTYFTNMIVKAPVVVIGTVLVLLLGTKLSPDCGNIPQLNIGTDTVASGERRRGGKKLDVIHTKLAVGIFLVTVAGIVVCAILKLKTWWPPLIGALLMVLTGVLDDRDALHAMSSPIIFIFVGTLPLATAISKTGCDTLIADTFNTVTAGWPPFLIMFAMYLTTMILSQFLQNSAVNSIFRLIAPVIAIQAGFNPVALMLAASMGSANTFLLPTANAVATMVYGESGMSVKQWFLSGLPYALLYMVVFLLWVPIVYPLV